MPLPKPGERESKERFMERCMGNNVMVSEYPDQAQRAAICNTAWKDKNKMKYKCKGCAHETNNEDSDDLACPECGSELLKTEKQEKMKLETKELKDVEIMDVGTWNGHPYTVKDFVEAKKNLEDGIIEPYVNLDHSPTATAEAKRALSMVGLGYVKSLKIAGTKLLANFKQVPKLIAELITAGALKKKSVEWWNKSYRHANGKVYNNVLEAVTFFGANGVPAVNTLADIAKFYKREPIKFQAEQDGEKVTIDFKNEEDLQVGEIKIDQAEYDKLKANQRKEEDSDAMKQMKADKAESDKKVVDSEAAKLKAEKEAADSKTEMESMKTAELEGEAEGFMKKIIETDHKLAPKFKNMKKAEYIRLKKAKDEEGLKLFKEELEARDKILNFGSITDSGVTNGPVRFKSEDADIKGDPTVRAEAAVRAMMKKENCTWAEANEKVGLGADGGDE